MVRWVFGTRCELGFWSVCDNARRFLFGWFLFGFFFQQAIVVPRVESWEFEHDSWACTKRNFILSSASFCIHLIAVIGQGSSIYKDPIYLLFWGEALKWLWIAFMCSPILFTIAMLVCNLSFPTWEPCRIGSQIIYSKKKTNPHVNAIL